MVRQDRAAGKLGDDRRVDAGELGVIHKEPRFSGPPHRRGLDRRLFGVGGGESGVQRHTVGPQWFVRIAPPESSAMTAG